MALAYLTAGDYEKAHTSARRGMGNRSPLVAELYALSATALDQMGKPEEAVAEFVQAIKAFPDNFSLHFNLAVTYAGLGDFKNAETAAEGTLRVKPDHPSAHFLLGQLYARQNEKIQALMALGRFLTLEPTSQRSDAAISGLKELLKPDYKLKQDGTPVIVIGVDDVVNPEAEGAGFQSIASQLKLVSATAAINQTKSKDMSFAKSPEYYGLIVLCSLVSDQANYPAGFAKSHYVPFYKAIEQRGFNNAFARLALASLDPGGATDWMKENRELFAQFTNWSRSYTEPDSSQPDPNTRD